ncbi:MAG: tRNA (adenosine(37)-N6)-threonylcarbamoyltransferase complex dimerization subunit type 1 TsaB [Pseudomonadota bacterium]
MKVLAFDTTSQACSVAYLETDQNGTHTKQYDIFERLHQGHAERLAPMMQNVMNHVNVPFSDLDRIAVTHGPGTFTGVRIGVATARGLALALKCEIVTTSSLHVIAHEATTTLDNFGEITHIAVATDARRNQIYLQIFDKTAKAISTPEVLNYQDALSHFPEGAILCVGNGGKYIEQEAQSIMFNHSDMFPKAKFFADLSVILPPLTEALTPLYLRAPDAKPQQSKILTRANFSIS